MSYWKEEKIDAVGKGLLKWRGGVQLDDRHQGSKGNWFRWTSACPKALMPPIDWLLFRLSLKPLELSSCAAHQSTFESVHS